MGCMIGIKRNRDHDRPEFAIGQGCSARSRISRCRRMPYRDWKDLKRNVVLPARQ